MDTSVTVSRRLDRRDAWCAAALLPVTVVFLLIFSCATSPLTPQYYSNDPAFFTLMGRALLHGKVPYADLFDMKGPMIFFVEALGQAICLGRTGAFVLQIVFDFCSILFLFLTARLFLSRPGAFASVFLALLFFSFTKPENMTEEYCLAPVCLCLYLAVRTCLRQEDGSLDGHPPVYAFVYGLCGGFILWTKVTHGAIVYAVVLYNTCSLLRRGKYKQLLSNALAYIGGLAAVTVPLLVWFAAHGALHDLLEGTFLVPLAYAVKGVSARGDKAWVKLILRLSPILAMLTALLLFRSYRQRLGRLLLCCGVVSILALIPGNGYSHYFTMAVPYVTLGAALVLRFLRTKPCEYPRLRPLVIAGSILYCASLTAAAGFFGHQTIGAALDPVNARINAAYASQGALIPPQERDSVLVYAGDRAPIWYEVTGILPCYKHCAYNYMLLSDELVQDYAQMLETSPP